MDLLRKVAKSLFYDIEEEYAIDFVKKQIGNKASFTDVIDTLISGLKSSETRYTPETIDVLKTYIEKEWMCGGQGKSVYCRIFGVIHYFSNRILLYANNNLKVKFDKLLRWKDLSLYLGEDVLISAGMATRIGLARYDWLSPLHHDCDEVNALLDKDLTETHVHLNGSTDNADLLWIYYMNNPQGQNEKVILAAWFRLYLYQYVAGELKDIHKVKKTLTAKLYSHGSALIDTVADVAKEIGAERELAKEYCTLANSNSVWDYTIGENCDSPYSLFAGERRLMHQLCSRMFSNHDKDIHGFIYLYFILKINNRKTYVQTKFLLGLENYKEYYHKEKETGELTFDLVYKYVAQTSVRCDRNDKLELRLSSDKAATLKDNVVDFQQSIFATCVPKESQSHISHIINIIKPESCSGGYRFRKCRAQLKNDINAYLSIAADINKVALNDENINAENTTPVCGLDIASTDLRVHPAVVAPFMRYAIAKGTGNVTYHIAEEFHDVLDGLRAVYELQSFVGGCDCLRMGHASVLGTDIKTYYRNVSHNVICTRLELVDNLVWIIKYLETNNNAIETTLRAEIEAVIEDHFNYMYDSLKPFNIEDYWLSLHLRGDMDLSCLSLRDKEEDWMDTHLSDHPLAVIARGKKEATALNDEYEKCNTKADETILYRMPSAMIPYIEKAQTLLLQFSGVNIMIESCPTSNLMIGPYYRYDELPVMRFLGKDVCVSVNTDTKGIFATSLYDEYSLLAVAMKKSGKDMQTVIIPTLQKLIDNSNAQLFDVNNMKLS